MSAFWLLDSNSKRSEYTIFLSERSKLYHSLTFQLEEMLQVSKGLILARAPHLIGKRGPPFFYMEALESLRYSSITPACYPDGHYRYRHAYQARNSSYFCIIYLRLLVK